MKSKEKKELHAKSIKELKNMVMEARNELAGLKIDKTQNKIKNTGLFSVKRKEIAQMLTIIRLKELVEISVKEKI
jgi:ribosomal protein L29